MSFFEYWFMAVLNGSNSLDENDIKFRKWLKYVLFILEVLIVTFLVYIIPELISIGRIPTLEELYVPFWSAVLMCIIAYIRIRKLPIDIES